MATQDNQLSDLPTPVARALADFVAAAREAFADDLRAVVLYGSAAEGRLRATSDVNVVLVLARLDPSALDKLRAPLQVARAAVRLSPMFLLEGEIAAAAESFAAKFTGILHRRRVLVGPDPFAGLVVPRRAAVSRLKQVLLNLVLRLRASYAQRSLREEELALVVAEAAGPLRGAAMTLLTLEGQPVTTSREALAQVARALGTDRFTGTLDTVSRARESGQLAPGVAGPALFELIELAQRMRERVERLS
jgi:hypothetical protein